MAESAAFEAACASLEASGALDRLVSRGTIRLVLKKAGLEARSVTASELAVAAKKLLPAELSACGLSDAETLCASIVSALESIEDSASDDTPEAVFARLGG